MKRLSLSALALLALFGLLLTGCPNGNTPEPEPEPVVEDSFSVTPYTGDLTIAVNGEYGFQAVIDSMVTEGKFTADESYSVTLSATSNVDITNLQVFFVENGETSGTGWGWIVLSDYVTVQETITAGTAFEATVTVPVSTTSSSEGGTYNKVALTIGVGNAASAPTLTITDFSIVKAE